MRKINRKKIIFLLILILIFGGVFVGVVGVGVAIEIIIIFYDFMLLVNPEHRKLFFFYSSFIKRKYLYVVISDHIPI